MRAALVGHFSPKSTLSDASSAAGNQVQKQILICMQDQIEGEVFCYSMTPLAAWPRGAIALKSHVEESVEFIGYLNFPILKHLIFSIRLLVRLVIFRPSICIQFNSYLFENFVLLAYKFFTNNCNLAIIIQDVNCVSTPSVSSIFRFKQLMEFFSLRLAKRFDLVIPISSQIIDDFNFQDSKFILFKGGITEFSRLMIYDQSQVQILEDIVLFAGSLEPHNGIDILVEQWVKLGIDKPLHIFGRGSLSECIDKISKKNKQIVFHGFCSESVILEWQKKSKWNLCLRYSKGLNEKYFFPSKFFNIMCTSGIVLVNDFWGIPKELKPYVTILNDDLSDLPQKLVSSNKSLNNEGVFNRHQILKTNYSWDSLMSRIIFNFKK